MSKFGERLRASRIKRGVSQAEVGDSCGVTRASVSQWETGVTTPSQDKLEIVAKFLGVDFYWLLTGSGAPSVASGETKGEVRLTGIPIVGTVEAGVWREADILDVEPSEYIDMPEDTRYQGLARRAVRVSGDSVDLEIPDGGYAVFVDLADYGKDPEDGQLVIVERIRHQGGLVETTVKEYRINGRGAELWPKSRNPKHVGPIKLRADTGDDSLEVRIRGVVVGKYSFL
jgi:transcriptional regulator with XRE-family HTH domain